MKQTAVEQLEEYLSISLGPDRMRLLFNEFEKAKEMEKEQIIQARTTAPIIPTIDMIDYVKEAEQYYNETFNK